ncbi:hypothetical protein PUF88_01520 [Lactobacillaceae bacterium L1_55_11]|nr:hypothetical protein [Lactobacillaceae bacterium L1_55_11]
MPQYNLIISSARVETNIQLPQAPQVGDIISVSTDVSSPHYLVHRIELFVDSNVVNLHVQRFADQLSAKLAVDGFRNNRDFL